MNSDSHVAFILGTRPEIIKLAPVVRECERRDLPFTVIHTGQHYSENLDAVFFSQLELPQPEYNLEIGSKSHGRQTGEMIIGIEAILEDERPDVVLVQGDTNSVIAGGITASKMDVELGHIEAGLRSFDREMPEEVNRRLTDHAADYLFAPTENTGNQLREEHISDEKIFVTGNTIVDSVEQNVDLATERSTVLKELDIPEEFVLLTAHRAENVDERKRFEDLLDGTATFARQHDFQVIYPIHPRAEKQLSEFDISVPDEIRLVEPQDFLDFLVLERSAQLIFTDSGGVQEEACILRTPCVTLRDNTERPETVDVDANRVVGTDSSAIVAGGEAMLEGNAEWQNPFGDGTAAEQILDVVGDNI